ncbi:hypothetical protein TSOC_013689 [Tetrabaena socialis]|uniref:Uncharacterized protein n=1 Tax=Tetrabaena socialis TaxID=47790 RepID=A0A2J7ZJP3_9CHLO|nr:hypothetical protein TSOC_013689 [Tetrabaena socialis]|eukprot:PNH00486.1 hypothetical protein TSOC_013689 [Tetrabaena socialis]
MAAIGRGATVAWAAYLGASLFLLLLLSLDPHFNQPSGLLPLEHFSGKPVRHGRDPCGWDYDGSWKIGSFSGPSPLLLNSSAQPLITCATVNTSSASFVAAPFLHIPEVRLPDGRCASACAAAAQPPSSEDLPDRGLAALPLPTSALAQLVSERLPDVPQLLRAREELLPPPAERAARLAAPAALAARRWAPLAGAERQGGGGGGEELRALGLPRDPPTSAPPLPLADAAASPAAAVAGLVALMGCARLAPAPGAAAAGSGPEAGGAVAVRAPLDTFRASLARNGHASAQQSMSLSDFAYTERYQVPYFKLAGAEYERIKKQPFCAGGLQGFVSGAASERLLLGPAVACSLDELGCIAPPGHSRATHMYDQTALTLAIRRNNYSSCLPRETHCTSAVRQAAWDADASSEPIVVASRRHRWPKPYQHRVQLRPGCHPNPDSNPWRSLSSEHPESVTKSSSLLFYLQFVYGQALLDVLVAAGCCVGFHLWAQAAVWGVLLLGWARRSLSAGAAGPHEGLPSCKQGPPLSPMGGGGGARGGGCWLGLLQPLPLLSGSGLMLLLSGLWLSLAQHV